VIAAALYALAKLLEFLDEKIYSLGSIVSGHTLKQPRRGRRKSRNPETLTDPPTDHTIISQPQWSI